MPESTPAHCGDLPSSYAPPLTLDQRLDQMEAHIREKMECASGFADVEVQRRRLISMFKFFDAPGTGTIDYVTFHACMVRMNFILVQVCCVACVGDNPDPSHAGTTRTLLFDPVCG